MNARVLLVAAVVAAALPGRADAVGHWSDPSGDFDVNEHGEGCFTETYRSGYTAVATANGTVTTDDPATLLAVGSSRSARPVDRFNDVRAQSKSTPELELCVGGVAPRRVVSGSAVYTLVSHHLHGESVVVMQCTFSRSEAVCR